MYNLQSLINNHGQLTPEDLQALASVYPRMKVVIKYGMSERVRIASSLAHADIVDKESRGDYVRETFLSASDLDLLRVLLGQPSNA